MDKRILFQPAGAPAAVLIPCDCGLTLEEIGTKDVPAGLPFWIVDADTVPADRAFREAWELDAAALGPASGVGGAQ
ncbi:hypothetical protein IDZ74_29610 [Pseudomonas aeruginosa]|uniref:hypothetical protein n=1 Tax=Pseudomonas aeruginosa TaxID=287 RepID=UPI001ADD1AD7|nr:hypothetical protein [Pseudomonas aeruginosa]MBO8406804.1 hypothetical protein [Pseudomonas aeruginosa]HBO8236472.1 hypothetical protein [Pseudomonas aeruginosa]